MSRAGIPVKKNVMESLASSVARQVAVALQDASLRAQVHSALENSLFRENKLHFEAFLRNGGEALLDGMANARGSHADDVLLMLDSIVDLEFYMPVSEHRVSWAGGDNLIVATAIDDDGAVPRGFDLMGSDVPLSADQPPATPTLVLVPVETDFSKPPAQRSIHGTEVAQSMTESPGLYMRREMYLDDREGWPNGNPEIEIHIFVRDGAGNFVDTQCAGEEQGGDFKFNHDESDEVFEDDVALILEAGIGTNPIEISVWEDDDGDPCDTDGGRPPDTGNDIIDDFDNMAARELISVIGSGSKTVGLDTLTTNMDLDYAQFADDPIGELSLSNSCFPSSGEVRFNAYKPDHGTYNGYAYLDFTFGTRSPFCGTPPPAVLSASVSGPTTVQSGASCTWNANVSGGETPYTYSWSGKVSGSSSQVTGSLTSSGWIYLDVDSDDGQDDGGELYVTVSPSGDDCIEFDPR
jgi:hypothetical protein